MTRCEFPDYAATTGYKHGCRCPRCFAAKQEQTRNYVRRAQQQTLDGPVSQATIDEWAKRVWDTWTEKEQRIVREVL